ncbi:unnamed protein product [Paramecium pentaurelia]|uniref:Tetratricopeptide repeat protein n=1 Tax=Paramecium pentaurelia TaxID=43138 RepID=A0A8S1YPL3_9CILI|nr:unnamed protein product [Paramecium pentaurelia]
MILQKQDCSMQITPNQQQINELILAASYIFRKVISGIKQKGKIYLINAIDNSYNTIANCITQRNVMIKPLKSIHIIIQHFIIRVMLYIRYIRMVQHIQFGLLFNSMGKKLIQIQMIVNHFIITAYELKSKLSIRIALYNLNCYQDAIQCNDQAIKIDPKYRDAFYNKDILILQFYIQLRQCLILVVSLIKSYRRLRSGDQNELKCQLLNFSQRQIRQHTCKCFRHEEQS